MESRVRFANKACKLPWIDLATLVSATGADPLSSILVSG